MFIQIIMKDYVLVFGWKNSLVVIIGGNYMLAFVFIYFVFLKGGFNVIFNI